jgi:hypothetical protein
MPGYIRFKFETKEMGVAPYITIYPIVCWHIGAAQSDEKFILEHIKRIEEDDNAKVVYLGDGGECVTKLSKGDLYGQLLNPQQQHDVLVEVLQPIKEKLLFGVRGNHGHRIYKETGLDFDANLCHRLGIPYLGVATFANITVNRSTYDLYFHHGIDSGVTAQAKVSQAEQFVKFIDADALFTAHSHYAAELMPALIQSADNHNNRVETKLRKQYICGSCYDSRTGYAEDKGYSPLIPAQISVSFDGRIREGHAVKQQEFHKFESDGQHEVVTKKFFEIADRLAGIKRS